MQVTLQFFERDAYIGSCTTERSWAYTDCVTDSRHWPHTAYFCAVCGLLWARSVAQANRPLPPRWALIHARCPSHGGGSLLCTSDIGGADAELLRRELLLSLKDYP